MADAFHLTSRIPETRRRRVLVTGASGQIGSYFATHHADRYDLRLMVRDAVEASDDLKRAGEVVTGDLSDLAGFKTLCDGIDTIVHMAADPSPEATWNSLLKNNIVGGYHLFVAAEAARCRRVVYASSIHAVSGYPADRQVHADDPVNPGDLYGVSKCFGEAMGRFMSTQRGLSVIVLRIGAFQPLDAARSPDALRMLDGFISHRDMGQLLRRCIDDESLRFATVHALSNNAFNRLDITEARELLGYEPQDDFTALNPLTRELNLWQRQLHSEQDGQRTGVRDQL